MSREVSGFLAEAKELFPGRWKFRAGSRMPMVNDGKAAEHEHPIAGRQLSGQFCGGNGITHAVRMPVPLFKNQKCPEIQNALACSLSMPRVDPHCVIRVLACKETEKLFFGNPTRSFPADLCRRARTKLLALHAASDLNDLQSPPGNRLEALIGDRKGQHSIRINQQYRLCFRWSIGALGNNRVADH